MGLMTTKDFENYFSLFNLMESFISAPDLLIHLRASVPTLVNQIAKRGRDYEESIRLDYLKRLNERYEAWISTYNKGPLLIVDVDNNNFRDEPEDLGKIIGKQGKTAKAMRVLLGAAAAKDKRRAVLEIIE